MICTSPSNPSPDPLLKNTGAHILEVSLSVGSQVNLPLGDIGGKWKLGRGEKPGNFSPLVLLQTASLTAAAPPLKWFQIPSRQSLPLWPSLPRGSLVIVDLPPGSFISCALKNRFSPCPSERSVASGFLLLLLFNCLTISCLSQQLSHPFVLSHLYLSLQCELCFSGWYIYPNILIGSNTTWSWIQTCSLKSGAPSARLCKKYWHLKEGFMWMVWTAPVEGQMGEWL